MDSQQVQRQAVVEPSREMSCLLDNSKQKDKWLCSLAGATTFCMIDVEVVQREGIKELFKSIFVNSAIYF